jgi:hypothetical protein
MANYAAAISWQQPMANYGYHFPGHSDKMKTLIFQRLFPKARKGGPGRNCDLKESVSYSHVLEKETTFGVADGSE